MEKVTGRTSSQELTWTGDAAMSEMFIRSECPSEQPGKPTTAFNNRETQSPTDTR